MSTNLPSTVFAEPTDSIDLGQITGLIRRRLGTIIFFVVVATAIAVFQVVFATPQFTVRGALYLGSAATSAASNNDANPNFLSDFSTQSDVETQIELITAGTLVQQAILETGLNASITPAGAAPLTYWRWRLFDGGSTDAFTPGPTSLQALYASTPGNYTIVLHGKGTYTLETRGTWLQHGAPVLNGTLGQPASGNGVQLLLEPAASRFDDQPGARYDLSVQPPAALADSVLNGILSVIPGGSVAQPTNIAFLRFEWPNPYQAQHFINQVMQDYIATQLSWKTQSASTTENFVKGQLANVSASLESADQALAAYQSQTGIVDVPQNATTVISQLAQYETQRTTVRLQEEALQQLNDDLAHSAGPLNPYLVSQTNDNVLTSLTSELADADVKMDQLRVQFTDNAEEVKIEGAQIRRLETSIQAVVRNDLRAAEQNLQNLDAVIARFQGEMKQMPAESLKITSLRRSSDVLGQLYVLLMQKQEEAQVSKAATIIDTRIVTRAEMPNDATSPRAAITIVFGAFAGLVLGIALVFAQRAFSGRYESEQEVRAAINLPVYGSVPKLTKTELDMGVFGAEGRNSFSEAFRLLRGRIYRNVTPGVSTLIMIISASKEDGKTTIAANLSKVLADDSKRVLLVDADLHLSRLRRILKTETKPGLTDWLMTGQKPEIEKWPGELFDVLPVGMSLLPGRDRLDDKALAAIIENLRADYEFLVLDCPPLPTVSDGMTLGVFADLILSVISVSHTPKQTLKTHNELIDALQRPHGIIINEVINEYQDESDAYFLG